jgi:hypothetical protein
VPKNEKARSKKLGRAGNDSDNPQSKQAKEPSQLSEQADFDILHVRRVVAGNPNTPAQVLTRLGQDRFSVIRRHVAENPRTPPEVLRELAKDPDVDVRLAVAENVHTPPDSLALLATDQNVDVRYDLAENRHLPERVLIELTKDDNPYVRLRALKTLHSIWPDNKLKAQAIAQEQSESSSSRHSA